MKSIQIYVQDGCDLCDQIHVPEGINVEKIYINRDDYAGFAPANIPVVQHDNINFEGPVGINILLTLVKQAQDGDYKG